MNIPMRIIASALRVEPCQSSATRWPMGIWLAELSTWKQRKCFSTFSFVSSFRETTGRLGSLRWPTQKLELSIMTLLVTLIHSNTMIYNEKSRYCIWGSMDLIDCKTERLALASCINKASSTVPECLICFKTPRSLLLSGSATKTLSIKPNHYKRIKQDTQLFIFFITRSLAENAQDACQSSSNCINFA